jgi:SH3-like domain-containing protein
MGYPLQVEKKGGKWLPVRDWQNRSGWVYRPLLSEVHTVIILVETANIRQGPSRKSRAAGYASKGEIYKVAATRGHWVKIAYYLENEARGWIYQNLVWGVKAGRPAAKH